MDLKLALRQHSEKQIELEQKGCGCHALINQVGFAKDGFLTGQTSATGIGKYVVVGFEKVEQVAGE
jgi:hypothetical protein